MAYCRALGAAALLSCLALCAAAAAVETPRGSISGPASGTDVVPSTVFQKEMLEGRSVSSLASGQTTGLMAGLVAAGAPGIEGLPGTQSGRAALPKKGIAGLPAKPAEHKTAELLAALIAVGAPGVEGLPDTQSGTASRVQAD
jgi:hypothetical protein